MNEEVLRPIIIVGAARSGTKILRDCLSVVLECGSVPYDVGYVWRYGNESSPDDCLDPSNVKPKTRRMVRRFLLRYQKSGGFVLEKTVGNTLRVPFVAEILPEARFVHLFRDGIDVTESTRREWQAPTNIKYLLRKVQHFPMRLVPTYGLKFLVAATWGRWRSGDHVGTWGPRYRGIDADLATDGLLAVCARQWRTSVTSARQDLSARDDVIELRYEELVSNPRVVLEGVARQLGHAVRLEPLNQAAGMIHSGSTGRGRKSLTEAELSILSVELGELLEELGYDRP